MKYHFITDTKFKADSLTTVSVFYNIINFNCYILYVSMYEYSLETVCDYKIIIQHLGFLIGIVQEPNDIIALPGKDDLFQCVFVDDRSLLVSAQFFRNGEPTKGLQRHVEFHNPGTTITIGLQIVNITRGDDGAVYHCSPVDRPNITSRLVTIKVAGTVFYV